MKKILRKTPLKTLFTILMLCVATSLMADTPTGTVVSGTIIDSRNGEALAHINVAVAGTMLMCETDATGKYKIENLPTGELTLVVRATGYRTERRQISSSAGEILTADFALERDEIALDEVVVSSNRNLSLRRNAPTLVSVVDTRLFNLTHSMCLAQGLNFQPGVRTEDNCQNCGFSQVRINGLDGHYSQILIDSRPVFSALQGVYGLEQIPANMIERVEVVRGGGSALFGSSAIGGTINIITKEPAGNSIDASHSLNTLGKNAQDNNTTVNASVVSPGNKAGFSVYGHSRHRDGYDRDGDSFTDLPKLINKTIGLSAFLRLSTYSKLTLHYHTQSEFRRGGNRLDLPAHEANIAEQLDHDINGGNIAYDLFASEGRTHLSAYASFENVDRKSYYGGTADGSPASVADAMKAYSTTHDLNVIGGAQLVHTFGRLLFMPADLTLGAEYSHDALDDHSLGYNLETNQKVRIGSVFFQNEWKNEKWSLLLGGRFDKHNLIKRLIFSPRANLRYNPTPDINLRLTYAGGFRAPQTFDEDLHTTLAGGERIRTRLAPNLREERSNSVSLSADAYRTIGRTQLNILVEGFFTRLDNVFATRKLDQPDPNGIGIMERYNAYRALVYGANIEGKAVFAELMQIQAGLTMQKSRYADPVEWDENAPAERRFLRTPDVYGYFTATLTPFRNFAASVSGNYTGKMLVGHAAGSGITSPVAVNVPDFLTVNLKLSYDFKPYRQIRMQINGGIQNITDAYQKDIDRGWNRDSAYIYGPSQPRSFFVGVKLAY